MGRFIKNTARVKSIKRVTYALLLSIFIASCGGGGGGQSSDGQTSSGNGSNSGSAGSGSNSGNGNSSGNGDGNQDPTDSVVTTPTIVAFDYTPKTLNRQYRSTEVQQESVTNVTGQFRLPIAGQNLTGNITVAVDVEDPDGIANVYVGFSGASTAVELCASDCGTTFHKVITGLNPLDFNLGSGSPRLELWSLDSQGTKLPISTVEFNWQTTFITGLNIARTNNQIDLDWNGLSNYLRYNVYIASTSGVTADNYQSLPDGEAFLAIRNPNHIINGKDNAKTFYAAVTGIDGSGESAFSQDIMVAALNGDIDLPPTANDDIYSMDEDTILTQNVTDNDTDSESQILTISPSLITNPINGTVTVNQNGQIEYTPDTNFTGTDHFSYQVLDGVNQTDTATVVIQVNQTNDQPESLGNTYNIVTVQAQQASRSNQRMADMTVQAPGLLINDIDIDSNNITVDTTPVVEPTQGTVVINSDGSFTYTNNEGATGEDQFTYRTIDGSGASAEATVRITIDGDSFFPIAASDRYTINQDQTLNADGTAQGRLSLTNNDTDFDTPTENFTVRKVRDEAHGLAVVSADGTFTYVPNSGFFGVDSFVYEVADPQGNTAQAGVIITVEKQNNPPTANPDTYIFDEDTNFTANAANGLTSNDIDVDLDNFNILIDPVSPPANGSVNLSTDGSFTYTPNANFAGADTFSYQLNDNNGGTAIGQVTLTIANVNDNPIAQDDNLQTLLNTPITLDVLANDSDVENDPLTISGASATNGTVINNSTSLDYTPPSGFTGQVQITYTISDGQGGTANATVFLAVTTNNPTLIATDDSYTTPEDQILTVSAANGLLSNDSDPSGSTLTVNTTVFTAPNNGQISLNSDGSFTYQSTQNFFGTDSFVYEILDNNGGTATATVSLNISSVNDAPNAVDDAFSAAEETLVNLNVLANDTDIENDTLTVVNASSINGTVTIQNDSTLNYTPNLNFFGTDTINYIVSDGNGGNSTAIVTMNVQNVNDNPTAVNDSAITDENNPITINVLANDSDIDGDTLNVLSANSQQGSVNINGDSSLTFTPSSGFNGNAQIDYTLSDGQGGTDTAQVQVTVNPVNDAPVALDDNATGNEDSAIDINVLANDSDIDGDALTIISATANNGEAVINSNDTISYLGNSNFNGSDIINYTISDGNGGVASAIVNLTINPVNDSPTAVNDTIVINEDTTTIINVLANDFDVDNNQSQLQVTSAIAISGLVSVLSDNTLSYQAANNFSGIDTINYTISDGAGGSASAQVTVTVNSQNDAPVANNDTFSVDEDIAATLDVLANDTDPDNDQLTIDNATASSGTLTNNGNNLSYQSASNFNGTVTVNYSISDGQGGSASAIATITVNPVNDLPIANNDSATTAEDTALTIDVLANDSDIETAQLIITTASANNGQVVVNGNNLVYTPTAQFNGADVINYTIADGDGATASAIVNVTVTNVNDIPVANADIASLDEDTTASLTPLVNDTDPDGDTLIITNATASNGAVVNNQNSLSYTPNANFNGSDTINYTISDGQGGNASSTISVTINPVNDLPVAVNDSATVDEDILTIINVLANDSDADGDTLTVTSASASQGEVLIQADQTLSYQPNNDFNGLDTINYAISDGNGGTASSTVSLSIIAVNDNPIANNDSATTDEDIALTIDALANDSDADGDTLAIASANAANGSVTINNGQNISYTPNANFNGTDSIEYTITDGQGGSANATIAVTINAINDLPVAVNDSATVNEDVTVTIDVISNDTDQDEDTLSVTQASAASGTVTINQNQLSYTPNTNFNGTDTIDYAISDGQGGDASAQVIVTVTPVNDVPVANSDSATTDEDIALIINALVNDTDADNDTLTISSATALQGTVQITTDNQISYAPNSNFNGTDSINYIIADGQGDNDTAVITVTINPVNDNPVLTADSATTDEDVSVVIDALANDTDVDNDTLSISSAIATNGTATITNNQISYSPDENFNGSDLITYDVSDGQGGSAQSTVALTINAVNDIPVAVVDTATGDEDTIISISVLANDTDIDGDTLTISQAAISGGASGTDSTGTTSIVTINGSNIDFEPNTNFNGIATIDYTISDGNGGEASSSATVTVVAVNDAPVASDDTVSIDEDATSTLNVLLNDSDVDGDTLQIQSASATTGNVSINDDQTLTYSPNSNFNGSDTISYTITDGALTASASVAITVNSVNDLPEPQPDTASTDEDVNVLIDVLANDTDPENDTLVIDSASALNGSTNIENDLIKYAPNGNFNGQDTITYQVSDNNGGVATSTVTVTIAAINDNPVAVADSAQTSEDIGISIDALANDTDVENDNLTIQSAIANNGSALISTTGLIDYTPNENFNGTDTISYTISDGELTASNIITVSVDSVNDTPKAADDEVTTLEDNTVTIDVLANDTDDDGDTITIDNVTVSIGSASIIQEKIVYTPTANYFGSDTITYQISDSIGATATATVTVTITSVNDAPEAFNDSAQTDEDVSVKIDVLSNDNDIDGDTISFVQYAASNGSVIQNDDLTLQYSPNSNFNGSDNISYTIQDPSGATATASVTVTVASVNDSPVATLDTITTNEDVDVLIDVLANDYDPDGDTISIKSSSALNGQTSNTTAGINYIPDLNFNGTDTITYTIEDVFGSTSTNTVTVTVVAVNDAPTAQPYIEGINEDTSITLHPLANASDVDGDQLSLVANSIMVIYGSIVVNSDDSIDYTPQANDERPDIISYEVTDGITRTPSQVTIYITPINDAPVAVADTATVDEDNSVTINVLDNDTDIENNTLTIKSASSSDGQSSIISGAINYTPNSDFNGTDVITYVIEDGMGGSDTGTATVTVNPINDAPVAANDTATTDEDTLVTIDVLKNDGDIDGDTLMIVASSSSADNGSIVVNQDKIDYTPSGNFNGTDTITYVISDGKLTGTGSVTVTVNPVNDDPDAQNDVASTNEDTTVNINVLANDNDPDGNLLNVSNPSADNGSVVVQYSDQTIDYTPNSNFNGTDSITYTVSNNTSSTTATVTVTVNPINDSPVFDNITETIAIDENSPNGTSVVTVSATDIDLSDANSSEALTFNLQTNSSNIFAIDSSTGLISINDNTSLNFESAIRHDIVVKVDDTNGGVDTLNVTINVNDVEEVAIPTIDTSFATTYGNAGTAGSNAMAPNNYTYVGDAKRDSSGRLVVVGRSGYSGTSADLYIARFTTGGHLDRTFGTQGMVITDLGYEETAYAVDFDSSGNIIIAGVYYDGGAALSPNLKAAGSYNTFVARYTSAGVLDTTFDSNGYNLLGHAGTNGIAGIEVNGTDIYIGISHYTVVPAIAGDIKAATSAGFKLIKVDNTGSEVANVNHAFESGPDFASTILKQSDGKLIITGSSYSSSSYQNFAAARFDISSGVSVDSSYANSGGVSLDLGLSSDDQAFGAAINSNDEIYLVGGSYPDNSAYYYDVAAIQLDNTGALVSGFGNSGILMIDADGDGNGTGDESTAQSITIDSSNQLYFGLQIGESDADLAIYKTDGSGTVQTAYGNSGKFDINIENGNDSITKVLIDDSDGYDNLLFVSTADPNVKPDLVVGKLTTAGAYDSTYGTQNGFNRIDTGYTTDLMREVIELQASPNTGKFAAIGVVSWGGGNKLIAARYNADGSIDDSFGQNGYFILQGGEADFNGEDIIEQSDGKLVIAGHQDGSGLIVRLDTNGDLDGTFASAGIYTYSPGYQLELKAVTIDGNNNIVAGGYINNSGDDALIIRLDSSGLLDSSFNGSGIASLDFGLNETIEDIAITEGNKIVGVGTKGSNAFVVQLTNSGTADTASFGEPDSGSFDGYKSIDLDSIASVNTDILRRVAILSDGSIIAAGESADANSIATVVKLTPAGLLDTNFDSDGIAQFNFGQTGSSINGLAIDAKERIVIAGYNSNGTDNDIMLGRISADGSVDSLFNTTGGKLWHYSGSEAANSVFIRSDGTIVIGGSNSLGMFPSDFFYIQKILLVEP